MLLPTTYFKIQVIDEATGRGVPLVQLETTNSQKFLTDSAGVIAFNEPDLMGRPVYFHVSSPGYSVPADQFGYRGTTFTPLSGKSGTLKMHRDILAERICRLTGEGIYRDSMLLGERPLTKGSVIMGQDTAEAEILNGKMMWFWGDTDRTSYPLGNFHTTGALATLPPGGIEKGIRFDYFLNKDQTVKPMVASADSHPIWISGLAVFKPPTVEGKTESLYASYVQVRKLGDISSRGILKWNIATAQFDIVQTFTAERAWQFIDGHTIQFDSFLYGNDPPNVRVPANSKDLLAIEAYEAFTCLDANGDVVRVDGKPTYRWQKSLPPITSEIESRLVNEGKLKPSETHFLPIDAAGKAAIVVSGSVHWNAYRQRWIGIFGRKGGKDSFLGEIDYAEAESPTGPFRRCIKVADHPNYTFYNPVHHSFLDQGSMIYFEGTYTNEFSGTAEKTSRYNYNQLLYRLDLSKIPYPRQ